MRTYRHVVLAAMACAVIGVLSGSSAYALSGKNPTRHAAPVGSYQVASSNSCHFVYYSGKTRDGRSDTCLRCVTGYYTATTWTSCPVRQAPNSSFVQCEPWSGASSASPGTLCASESPSPAAGNGPPPEAATTEVVTCNGKRYYIYTYLNRPAFRAVLPPDWSHAIGGRDFPTHQQAYAAACGGGQSAPTGGGPNNPNTINLLGVPYGGGNTTGTGGGGGQPVQNIAQGEQRDASGRITVEASTIHVVACNNGRRIYVYEYLNRPGFRAILPPDWSHPLGGHDFPTYGEAVSAGCR